MSKDSPFSSDAELLIWGPAVRYPLLRMTAAAEGLFIGFAKEFLGHSWPPGLILMDDKRFVWMHELKAIEKNGGALFLARMLPRESREKARTLWKEARATLEACEQKISPVQLAPLTNDELHSLWNEFQRLVAEFWVHSSLPELSNYGSIPLLRTALQPFVKDTELASVLETLTAPEEPSFYQEEEMMLSETSDLPAHQQQYFWLKNSYANVEVLPLAFFEERKKTVSPHARKEFIERVTEVKRKKTEVIEKYQLPQEVVLMAEAVADGIVWQDMRKGNIWTYLHYEDVLVEEIARRTGIEKELLLFSTYQEVASALRGTFDTNLARKRMIATGLYADKNEVSVLDTDTVQTYWKTHIDTAHDASVTEFKGVVASKGSGIVKGRVRIVLDAHNPGPFDDGDILVTTMTTPEFVFIMKKAGAVVTDTGGLTSHAAIVSRELKVACIIGTKIATKVFKDGDMVEVDADAGVVRKI